MSNIPMFAAVAGGVGIGAKVLGLPLPFVLGLSVAAFAICIGVSKSLQVEIPKPQPKPKKISKKEKRALAAASAAAAEPDSDEEENAKKAQKAAKKREKERAKKEAKKAAERERQRAQAEEKAEKEAAAAALSKDEKKKKKKKKKKGAAAPAAAEPEEAPAAKEEVKQTGGDNWEEVKVKKGKHKKVLDDDEKGEADHSEDVLIDKKYFGLIIGEKGATLRALQEATGCEIDLPKKEGVRREIIITGSPDGCAIVKKALKQLVKKGYSDLTHAGTMDTTITVPDKKRSLLIGPRGKNIQAIQNKTGVRINMPEKGSDSDEVTLVGDNESVQTAMAAIKQLLDQGYSDLTHENFVKQELEVQTSMLAALIGQGGSTIQELQKTTGCRINVPSGDRNDETIFVSIIGPSDAMADCCAQIRALMVPPELPPIPKEWTQEETLNMDAWD